MPCGFLFAAVLFVCFAGKGELFGHVVEQAGELGEFVIAGCGNAAAEIAAGNGACAVGKLQNGFYKAAGEIEGGGNGEQHRQHGGNKQGDKEEGLQAFLGEHEFGVFGAGGFDEFGIFGDIGGNRLPEKQGGLYAVVFGQQQPAGGEECAVCVFYAVHAAFLHEFVQGFFVPIGRGELLGVAFGGGFGTACLPDD